MTKLLRWVVNGVMVLASVWAFCLLTPLLSSVSNKPEQVAIIEPSAATLFKTTRQQVSTLTNGNMAALKSYDNLIKIILNNKDSFSQTGLHSIAKALVFATKQHQGQMRKNAQKTPYICYPLDVTYDLIQVGRVKDPSVIVASILHDTVGDKNASVAEIQKQFGPKVANLVQEVSSYPVSAKAQRQRALLLYAPKQSAGATQIDLADLLYSLKELSTTPPSHWKKEQVDHYFEWAQSVLARFPDSKTPLHVAAESTIQTYWG